ncbi:MAG: hypothetical protein NTV38_07380 [Chloroflexi bacterium]|nr:hypothetical protein [Chloroflexota bacterium]
MKCAVILYQFLAIASSACGSSQPAPTPAQASTITQNILVSETALVESTPEVETIEAIPSFTPLTSPCSTPAPNELNDFIKESITIEDNGKTFVSHVTSRFWIYLDDRIYPLQDLINSIPEGLIGDISNGSIRGPQCYPIMFEAVHEGKGHIKIKDFQLSIIIDNNLPISPLPLH